MTKGDRNDEFYFLCPFTVIKGDGNIKAGGTSTF